MKTSRRSPWWIRAIALAFGALWLAGSAAAATPSMPPQSSAFGKSLADWTETYWRWYYTGEQPSLTGRLALLPLPSSELISGSWTPDDPAYLKGTVEVTLAAGTPFVVPLFGWTAETYDPELGIPDDPSIDDQAIRSMVTNLQGDGPPLVTLDGRQVFKNFWDYYVEATAFDPAVTYPTPSAYGSIGAVSFQGVTLRVNPLPPGTHTLKLLEKYIIADYPGIWPVGLIYDNTWIVHVKGAK